MTTLEKSGNSETRYLADTVVKTEGYLTCDKMERRRFRLTYVFALAQSNSCQLPSREKEI